MSQYDSEMKYCRGNFNLAVLFSIADKQSMDLSFRPVQDKIVALPPNMRGALSLMFAALFFSLMVALIKFLGERLHITQILLMRQCVMTAIILPTILRKFPGSLSTHRPLLQILRIIFALTAMLAGFTAVIHLQLADATAIAFAKSFFVVIFAVLILGEKVGPRRWGAVFIGFVGVGVMLQPGSEAYSIYGLYALLGSASAGLVMVIIRLLSKTESTTTILTWQALGVGGLMVIPGVLLWQSPTLAEWGLIMAMGIVSYAGQMLNITAFKWGEASLLASLDYVRLVFATIIGYFLFANLPSYYTWAGATIIIAAAIYIVQREARAKPSHPKGMDR